MRIGELAALAGVTTRTVRHYHHIGLLPETARQANGYREYGLRDAVRLSRIRRLTELGLSLDEVGDILADEGGAELHEVLTELDADLARQEEAIRRRRARLAELLKQAEEHGGLPAEGPVSPELADLFDEMARESALRPGPEPSMAAKERELLALLEGTSSPATRAWLTGLARSIASGPAAMRRAYEVYERMDELAGAAVDDPRVGETARAIVEALPIEVVRELAGGARTALTSGEEEGAFAEAYFADLAPAQAAAVRAAMELLAEEAE
ncbi:MerR family transcriptional regulator [Streptomyces litchfieldiae]|uniref:MerR family transcriptional regulator n=1 Tax=Streptomyces litchfieldiae TaxID=3075543 RepID=A0ABU2MK42_9ACTN|nr:MerR family transcriptional regulator [Streptomyces sp. DSM 44938]MDT0341973.1 MerR family transcriptional regulator [Streptomyces sp. DSM 44938]